MLHMHGQNDIITVWMQQGDDNNGLYKTNRKTS